MGPATPARVAALARWVVGGAVTAALSGPKTPDRKSAASHQLRGGP